MSPPSWTFFFLKNIYLFGCAKSQLQHMGSSSVVGRSFNCGIWDLVPPPGIKLGPPALGVQSLSCWITGEIIGNIFHSQSQIPGFTLIHHIGLTAYSSLLFSLGPRSSSQGTLTAQMQLSKLHPFSIQFLLPKYASSVQFSRSVVSNSFRPHELQHARPPCPSPTPGVHSNSRPSSR